MKKIPAITVLIFVVTGISFAQNGIISEMTGTVELMHSGTSVFVSAKKGDLVSQNTVISTGFKSTALIRLGNSVITVRPLTRLTLAELNASAGTETINVNLLTGRVRVDVNPPAGTRTNMTVQGPSATASVRGTSFLFNTRNITVEKGIVAFRGNRGSIQLVTAGSSSQVKVNEKAADPLETSAAKLLPLPPAGSVHHAKQSKTLSSNVNFGFVIMFP